MTGLWGPLPDRPGELGWAARWLYDAYGNRKLISGGGASGGTASAAHASSVGYRSQLHDSATGDIYLRNRFYSPTLGRFSAPDPIGYAGGFNLYAYSSGNRSRPGKMTTVFPPAGRKK